MKKINILNKIGIVFMLVAIFLLVAKFDAQKYVDRTISSDEMEEIIKKYALTCYAMEGSYPEEIEYLSDNYGLIIDDNLYVYSYDFFASNIMPEIRVAKRIGRDINDQEKFFD